jgi:uncharacterized membrane protein YdjX (TVP38/TMEM64 family)
MNETVPVNNEKTGAFAWLKKRYKPLVGLLLALAIIFAVGWLYFQSPGFFDKLKNYGYFGAFVISVFLNATVIIPVSNMVVISSLGAVLPLPYVVGLAGGIGAAIGEMTGYIAGRSGRGLLSKSNAYNRVEGWVKKRGWIAIFILSIVPFAFDVVGIIAGALRMPVWRFFVACWLGRTIIYIIAAYLGDTLLNVLPWSA